MEAGEAKSKSKTKNTAAGNDNNHSEGNMCSICATEHPQLWAITECNHRVCHVCSLRMRCLYKNQKCALCKCESKRIIIVKSNDIGNNKVEDKRFLDLYSPVLPCDDSIGVYFENGNVREQAMRVTLLTCPIPRCQKRVWPNMAALKGHVKTDHQMSFCDICLTHKKVFPFEMRAYGERELHRHQRSDQGNVAGHPTCPVCGDPFYSEDELAIHLRERYEVCHICQRRPGGKPRYFRNYSAMEEHFRRDHYQCEEPLCLEMKFVVFETELEHKSHMASMHLNGSKMQRSAQKEFRRIETGFSYSSGNANRNFSRKYRRSDTQSEPNNANIADNAPNTSVQQQPQSQMPQVKAPLSKTTIKHLLYGEAIGDLAQRLQSLTMYEQQNVDFCESLKKDYNLPEIIIGSIKGFCRQFQKGELTAVDLVVKLEYLMGNEKLEKNSNLIVSLQLDGGKRSQLQAAIKAHLQKIAAFPPLPVSFDVASTSNSSNFGSGNTRMGNMAQRVGGTPLPVVRITPKSKTPYRLTPGMDPSKNPLALLGTNSLSGSSSNTASTSKGKKQQQPPSFRQSIASPSSVGIIDPISTSQNPLRSSEDFPHLITPNTPTIIEAPTTSNNIFAMNAGMSDVDSFVIGSSRDQEEYEDRKDAILSGVGSVPSSTSKDGKSSGGKKKNKGHVLMRFG